MLAVASLFLLATGVLGVGRAGGIAASNVDMRYLYAAGEVWEQGDSPYDKADYEALFSTEQLGFEPGAFAYPPHIAPLALALSAGSLTTAKVLMTLLNLGLLVALAWLSQRILAHSLQYKPTREQFRTFGLFAAAVVLGNPFAAHVLWMGQTSLVAAALVVGAWYAAQRQRDVLAGVLLGMSTVKPQLVILFIAWFVLDRRWLLLATGVVTAGVLALWPTFNAGAQETWLGWYHALTAYQADSVTAISFKHVFGLRSLFFTYGLQLPTLAPLALVSVFLCYRYRDQLGTALLPGLLFASSALFIYAHDYDLVATAAMAAPLLWLTRGNRTWQITLLVCFAVLFFPQRIWEKLNLADLARTRELALLALSALLIRAGLRDVAVTAPVEVAAPAE